jgi:hypothetical protein
MSLRILKTGFFAMAHRVGKGPDSGETGGAHMAWGEPGEQIFSLGIGAELVFNHLAFNVINDFHILLSYGDA